MINKNSRLQYLIENGIGLDYVQLHKEYFLLGLSEEEIQERIKDTLNDKGNNYAFDREKLVSIEIYDYDIQLLHRYSKNHYDRNTRLKKKIKRLLEEFEKPIFITLTFTDKSLEELNEETRRRYVSRFLKSQGVKYVANIDYGKTNGREHYHAVASGEINPLEWPCGACNVKYIRDSSEPLALAKYINKLVNHAKKIENKLIYSKGLKISTDKTRKLNDDEKESLFIYMKRVLKR